MITVPEATEKIVKRSRYLSEAMSKDLINLSSLARYIKPEIEEMLIKEVSLPSVIMALKRLSVKLAPTSSFQNILSTAPQLTVRSSLSFLRSKTGKSEHTGSLFALTQNEKETVALVEKQKGEIPVSAITIKLEKNHKDMPGVYYFFLKSLAWERINVLGIFATEEHFTIVIEDKDTSRAFGILKTLGSEVSG
ncbi:MAG: hypothetical protein ACM3IJ_03170 [Candidatus Levyibacteriota bacterium]